MATPIKNNLPPASQQWVRDMEKRLAALERDNALLQVMANKNATTIGSIQESIAFSRVGITTSGSERRCDGPSSGGSIITTLQKPSWAASATFIGTLSFDPLLSVIGDKIYYYDATIKALTSGPDIEIFAYPHVGISNVAGSSLSGEAFSHTVTTNLDPGVTAITLGGIVDTLDISAPSKYLAYITLTAIWSRSTVEGSV